MIMCVRSAIILCGRRETAAAPLWQTTASLRPVGIVCWGWWVGEPAAPWQRSQASTPECPDFCPGYLRPWGWETWYFLFYISFKLFCIVFLYYLYVIVWSSVINPLLTTCQRMDISKTHSNTSSLYSYSGCEEFLLWTTFN